MKTQSLTVAYETVKGMYYQSRAYWLNAKQLVSQGSPATPGQVERVAVFNMHENPALVVPQIAALAQVPGLIDYARSAGAENNPSYDPVAEFQAWRAALFAVRDHIEATFPKDAQGFLAIYKFNGSQPATVGNFPTVAPDMVTLAGLIDNIIATPALQFA
jgi:hypothetical protein